MSASQMFDPLLDREPDPMADDVDILMLDASFDTSASDMCSARDRSFTDSVVFLTPDRKRKRLEQQRHFHVEATRRRLAFAINSTIHFFGRIIGCIPNIFALSRFFVFRRDFRGGARARPKEGNRSRHLDDEFQHHVDSRAAPQAVAAAPFPCDEPPIPGLLDVDDVFECSDDEKENGKSASMPEGHRYPRSNSMQHTHVRSQSLQQCPSSGLVGAVIPSQRHPRSQSLSFLRSMPMPTLIEERIFDENTVLCGDRILHARYRDSHEPQPFSEHPPSPELLNGRKKKAPAQQSFDTGYGNTTQYQKGPIRRAMKDFRSLEETSCQEYLEAKFRRQNAVLEELRSKIPKPPQRLFKRDPKLQRSSGQLA
jgi:hypothetical protein